MVIGAFQSEWRDAHDAQGEGGRGHGGGARHRPGDRPADGATRGAGGRQRLWRHGGGERWRERARRRGGERDREGRRDRKSTRLNSSHSQISYAVFCLKKKKTSR